jgi:hypothetical protein
MTYWKRAMLRPIRGFMRWQIFHSRARNANAEMPRSGRSFRVARPRLSTVRP